MEIVVRASVIFWLLWFLLRVSGKRELAEMTPFELIILMVMGDLIAGGDGGGHVSDRARSPSPPSCCGQSGRAT